MNVLSFSGGKDSMGTGIWMVKHHIPIDVLLFSDTRKEFPKMYVYLNTVVSEFFNRPIEIIGADMEFEDIFYQKRIKGKHIGEIHGWPMTRGCWWNDYGKIQPINKYKRKLAHTTEVHEYIGISAEEYDRYADLIKPFSNRHAPLYENGITGEMAKQEQNEMGLLNPLYDDFYRLGCYLCPQQRINELQKVRKHYPKYWAHMLELDNDSPVRFKPDGTTVHDLDRRFAWESGEEIEINGKKLQQVSML